MIQTKITMAARGRLFFATMDNNNAGVVKTNFGYNFWNKPIAVYLTEDKIQAYRGLNSSITYIDAPEGCYQLPKWITTM